MKSYKQVVLKIVRNWHHNPAYLVDEQLFPANLQNGCLIMVLGGRASGRTTLAWHIAKRIHDLGYRAPALIDEYARHLFDRPREPGDPRLHNIYHNVRNVALSTHTTVVLVGSLARGPTGNHRNRVGRTIENYMAVGAVSLLTAVDLCWLSRREESGVFSASLMKSRMMSVRDYSTSPRIIPAIPEVDVDLDPYFRKGVEISRHVRERYG